MPKILFKFGKITPNRLYLITAIIDLKISICLIVKGFYQTFYEIHSSFRFKHHHTSNPISSIIHMIIGFFWTSLLLFLLYTYKNNDSFMSLPHKIYFLAKLIVMLYLIPFSLYSLIASFHNNLELTIVIPLQVLVFNWNWILMENFQRDKVGHLNSVSASSSGHNTIRNVKGKLGLNTDVDEVIERKEGFEHSLPISN